MKWSKKLPDVEGWWWVTWPRGDSNTAFASIYQDNEEWWCRIEGLCNMPLRLMPAYHQWAGPIEEPQETWWREGESDD